ncbi:RNA recognition family protein [Cryptosporidium andersoni]|uniref:RNA recognition family protein n=1 Tax=Cryptosporidium andersoni TaxID=117008 RepID=A0A1J4MTX8_9CRYT|nr:RNA recognition family protein [Cryptosporidium andersoni]
MASEALGLANSIFIKNISPLATEESVCKAFEDLKNEILGVSFHVYPGTSQRFCQVDFKTSSGVTNAMGLNGSTLLGVPMSITVIAPVPIKLNMKYPKISPKSTTQRSANTLEERLSRTILVENIPEKFSQNELKIFFSNFGSILDISFEQRQIGDESLRCTIEFENKEEANKVRRQNKDIVLGDRVLRISTPKFMMRNLSQTSEIQYTMSNVMLSSVPVAYQQIKKLQWESKLAKVDEVVKELIDKKLLTEDEDILPKKKLSRSGDSHKKIRPEKRNGIEVVNKDIEYRYRRSRSFSRSPPT